MKLVRRILVNNGDYRAIYKDNVGIYYCFLENEDGVSDNNLSRHYLLAGDRLSNLYNDYYNKEIPEDFLEDYEVVEEPIENASDGDVIALLNWYRYKYC